MKRIGYGQVEPNHLSAQRNGQIYAQNVWDSAMWDELENGMFLCPAANKGLNLPADDIVMEPLLVYNEVKTYDARESYKDFALKKSDSIDGKLYPRLFKTAIGDIFTTNTLTGSGGSNDKNSATKIAETLGDNIPAVGNYVIVSPSGYLSAVGMSEPADPKRDMLWIVIEKTTMPDGQGAVKLQRVR